jgi:hypothetical protein
VHTSSRRRPIAQTGDQGLLAVGQLSCAVEREPLPVPQVAEPSLVKAQVSLLVPTPQLAAQALVGGTLQVAVRALVGGTP